MTTLELFVCCLAFCFRVCVSTFSEASSASVVFCFFLISAVLSALLFLTSLITVGWIDDFTID